MWRYMVTNHEHLGLFPDESPKGLRVRMFRLTFKPMHTILNGIGIMKVQYPTTRDSW
jgi:hypothetical protein